LVKYSIVMTSFNNEKTIEPCLTSLYNQINENYEIIIVDNLSSDGTTNILDKWSKKPNITVIYEKCSRGLGRKLGVDLAKGDYLILQLDCDEVFKPILNQIIAVYESEYTDILLTFNKSEKIMFCISPRELVIKIGNYRDINYHEDRDLYWRCALWNKFGHYYGSEQLVKIHERGGSLSWKILKRLFDSSIDSFRIGDLPPHLKKTKYWTPLLWLLIPFFYIYSKLMPQFENKKGIREFKEINYKVNKE